MQGFSSFLTVIATILFLLISGFILRKTNIIDDTASNRLSKLIINIAQPMLIIHSLTNQDFTYENLKSGGFILVAGLFVHFLLSVFAFLFCAKIQDLNERKITEFSMVLGNCGFIGFPIFESLFGANGLFLGAFFVISFHLTLWTWGLSILARNRNDIKLTWKKVILNLGTIPCTIGIVLYVAKGVLQQHFPAFDFPQFFYDCCNYLGSLCTPISVLITGALIATKPLKQLFTSAKLYYLSAVKLLIIPMLVCLAMTFVGFDYNTLLFCTVAASMPSAAVASMLAELHSISPSYASQAVGFTTLISVATMPCVLFIAPKLINLLG
ncbi:MAG: AEC family transporter [Clostridia bacterium]|nr:AEC family transporter [Clostridia bacterium]